MKIYLILTCFVAAAGGFLFGFDTSVISGVIEYLVPKFGLDEIEKGWTVGCILIGCMAGSIAAGPISSKFGRKKALMFSAIVFLVSSIGCALSNNYTVFIINRMIAGIAVGAASTLAPIYIAEISPASHRGKLLTLNLIAIILGQTSAFFSNYFLQDVGGDNNWRWMIGVMAIPSFIFFALLFFVPESPRWLVESKKEDEALNVLKRLNSESVAQSVISEIKESLRDVEKKKIREMFTGLILKVLIIGCFLSIFQQVTGINIIMYFAPSIFKAANFAQSSALFQTALIGVVYLTFSLLSMFFVDKLGRKPLMIIGSVSMGISLVLLALTFITNHTDGYLVMFCIMGFIASFGFSLGPIVWVLIPEIFPNHYRSMGVAMSVFVMWAANFLVTFTFPFLLKVLHGHAFFIYAFMCVLCLIFSVVYLRETKGKSLEELEHLYADPVEKIYINESIAD
jgi:sugar porter (SP) family MFS transporter